MTALQDLLEKVEAGTALYADFALHFTERTQTSPYWHATTAYEGSLDAAKALHEAVLPGWEWTFYYDGERGVQHRGTGNFYVSNDTIPSRAWLIAILRALIALEGEA